jgi:hypothetical protein
MASFEFFPVGIAVLAIAARIVLLLPRQPKVNNKAS